jgi:hypothetical protein
MNFSELSVKLTKNLSKETKKNEGIYFTPKSIITKIIDFVKSVKPDINSVLEPSCGSGQFLECLDYKNVTAIEKNETIHKSLNKEVILGDFLEHVFDKTFDLVIGNPPYFVVSKKSVDKKYYKYFDGRPNIYILFIIKSFELLNENGILAFVLPNNFLNCIYYNELRKYLKEFKILDIYTSKEKFLDTTQEICIFIVQKTPKVNSEFFIHFDEIVLFKPSCEITKIKELKQNSTTLYKLGCTMNIGTVVWNQCKNILTDDTSKTLLIYSGDFKNNVLEIQSYREPAKKNYINKKGSTDTVLLVNRGYGTGKYNLNYCLVENKNFLVENHCIVIHSENKEIFQTIINSFENKKTKEFIDIVFSNNAINIEEFLCVLPIFF